MLLQNMIIHQKLSEVGFSSLCHLMRPNRICISSKSYANLLNELFPSAYPKTIFVIYSSSKIIEVPCACTNIWLCLYLNFSIVFLVVWQTVLCRISCFLIIVLCASQLQSQKVRDFGNDPTLLHKIVDFEVDTSEDREHPSDPAIEFFIKAHSTALFKTAAIKLNYIFDVSKRIVTF